MMKSLEKYLEDQNFQPGILQKSYILQESLRIPRGVISLYAGSVHLQCKMST